MKTQNFVLLAFVFLLFSCDQPITFTQPQPENIKSLNKIPTILQGVYTSSDFNDTLFISSNKIVLHLTYVDVYLKSELDSSMLLKGDTLCFLNSDSKEKVIIRGDSLLIYAYNTDEVLNIQSGDILKRYKGYYFLNSPFGKDSWTVSSIQYFDDKIMISDINTDEEIELLRAMTETKSDTIYNFEPSKKQFKEFVKAGGFGSGDLYYRLNK